MTSVEFLKVELQALAAKFPNVHIKYGFNTKIDLHIVELLPLIEYTTNKKLDEAWIPVSINFLQTFKDEEVNFISSDSRLSLKESIFEFNENACSEENIIAELFSKIAEQEFNYEFPTSMPNGRVMENAFFNIAQYCIKAPLKEESYFLDNAYPEAA